MQHKKDKIVSKLPGSDGMTVPDNYFDDFASRMIASLPERPELQDVMTGNVDRYRTLWQRLRPYVYMAAMFAGVWLMLKLFTLFTAQSPVPFESNPIVAEAFSNDSFVNDYVISDLNQWDLYDDLMSDGLYPDAFLDSVAFSQMDVPDEYVTDF